MNPSLLENLAGHRVLCVGDIMLDRYVYGQVERVSPEAPIPVLHTQREETTLGGVGNVVRNIVDLGGQAEVIGVIGADSGGGETTQRLSALKVTSHLLTDPTRPSTLKTRYVANGQQLLRADQETSRPLAPQDEDRLIAQVQAAMEGCAILILSDYAKGVLTPLVLQKAIEEGRRRQIPVLIDPKGRDYSRYRGASLITPNRKELAEASGQAIRSVEEAEKAARTLIAAHDLGGMLVKLGGDGVCLVLRDQPAQAFRATTHEVYDVSGAGDTVLATMALGLAGGLEAADSAALANIAGSIVVGKVGTATVTRDELAQALMQDQTRRGEGKVLTREQAVDRVERWRKQGLKVGFTNGCFDLLHPGHLSLIRQARAACDRLVLGLNSDASVKRLKGETRPVQSESARAAVLASLSDVDAVVIFGEDTPLELIKALKPSLLVKGADYTLDRVVGGDLVIGWGGQVLLAQLVEGQSTTATISRLRA